MRFSAFQAVAQFTTRAVSLMSGLFSFGLTLVLAYRAAVGAPVGPQETLSIILYSAVLAFIISGFASWAFEHRRVRELTAELDAPLKLDVQVTGIQSGPWGEGSLQGWRAILTGVRITNRSPSHRVNLTFQLHVKLLNGIMFPIDAAGKAALRQLPAGDQRPDNLASPLDLAPEKSTDPGWLHFLVSPLTELFSGKFELDGHQGMHVLTVLDLVSKKFIEIKVPNASSGMIVRLPPGFTPPIFKTPEDPSLDPTP